MVGRKVNFLSNIQKVEQADWKTGRCHCHHVFPINTRLPRKQVFIYEEARQCGSISKPGCQVIPCAPLSLPLTDFLPPDQGCPRRFLFPHLITISSATERAYSRFFHCLFQQQQKKENIGHPFIIWGKNHYLYDQEERLCGKHLINHTIAT